jgi:AbrB family looped-hinge helix DNA binding protein
MRITSKGQVTIPQVVRERFGFHPHTEIEFHVDGQQVTIRKRDTPASKGHAVVEGLRGRATVKMSTDEIMALTRGE